MILSRLFWLKPEYPLIQILEREVGVVELLREGICEQLGDDLGNDLLRESASKQVSSTS